MKIMHMISGGDVGGAKTHVLSILEMLSKTETVHLVCFMEGDFAQEARGLGIATTVLEGPRLGAVCARILAMIRHDGYQLIHCHGGRANLVGAMLRKRAGIPIVTTVHSDYRLDYMGRFAAAITYGTLNKIALRRFDAWIGVSNAMSQMLIERGFNPQRIFTVYNGVDFSDSTVPVAREAYLRSIGLEAEPDSVVLGIAARISPVKDMTTLLRAFAQAVRQCPSLRLAIAGDGEQAEEIKALAQQTCPAGTVCFAGWVQDMRSFYNALDVNLLTSLSETFPYVLLEGAQMHCATISSNVGGVPALITNGVQGLLFPPQDADKLAQHMVFMATHQQERLRMGEALYEKAHKEFSTQRMLAQQKEIYETILRRAHRAKTKRDGVLICGAYGRGNNGDEAILDAIVEQMRHIDPDIPICAISRTPEQTRIRTRIDAVYTFNILKMWKKMRRTRLYISGGGTLLQDVTSTRSLQYYLGSIRMAACSGAKVMLYGCGVGPIIKEKNRRRTAKTLNRYVQVITLRDRDAEVFLQEIDVTRPKICLTADPALIIQPGDDKEVQALLRQNGFEEGKRYMMITVRPWKGIKQKLPVLVQAAEYAYQEYGLIPVLYPMEESRDFPITKALARQIQCPKILMHAIVNGNEVVGMIKEMSLLISMRLHALVFAAGQGVPMIGIAYDPKISGFMKYAEQKACLKIEEVAAETLRELIDQAMKERAGSVQKAQRLRSLAIENEYLAKSLLEEESDAQ